MTTERLTEGRVVPAVLQIRDTELTTAGRHQWLEGRAVPYGVAQDVGWYVETIEKGCFAKSIREAANGLPLLLFHVSNSLDSLIGRADSWREESDGLHGVWKLSDTEEAAEAGRRAANGDLGYMSVGFQPIRSVTTFDQEDRAYITRQEARLLEVSLTPTPAYQAATVTKVRTAEHSLSEVSSGRRIAGWSKYLDEVRGRS